MLKIESETNVTRRICSLMYTERKAKNMSQQELCKFLGITQGLLSKIENTKLSPSLYVWMTFCRMFSINAEIALNETQYKKRIATLKKKAAKLN